ncbi:MAG: glycosyltransferase family 4 protein [Acutalibacter sp.]|jgi:glycosyltransferase involved in cell wall biosynthesis
MKLYVKDYAKKIYVYGNPAVRPVVCRDLQRLGLSYEEVGSSPEEVADLSLEEGAPLVIALGPEDAFGKIRRELVAQNESLQPHIWRDIEFFSELLTHAQVEDAPLCPEPERSVAVGMNIDFVLGGAETWATQLFFELKRDLAPQGILVRMWEPRQQSGYLYVGREFYGIAAEDVIQFGMFDGFVDYTLAVLEQLTQQPPLLYFDNGSMHMLSAFYLAKKYLGLKTRILSVLHGDFSIFFDRVTRCQEVIDGFVAVSDDIAEHLRQRIPHRAQDISVYLQLPPVQSESLEKKSGSTLNIAYAARLDPRGKRCLWLLDVMDGLAAAGVDFALSVAGDGEGYEPLKEHIQERSLGDRVHLLGRIPHQEMDAFYQDKDVFVNFSVSEGGPLTLFESLSHGLVPVVTDAGCAKRFVREGENGYLIDSPEAAVEALKVLAGDLTACRALGAQAQRDYHVQRQEMEGKLKTWLAASGIAVH